eukprot:TRINITY_DN84250_c0_g1_i1.p1 TRINITY_DN84250_c0_g1~~TRINITY_DN84250_c0_g1_i1.p1  ORF type:complete len:300 (+),score=68.53 TRINITY_DN84250_c0_g1_i1:53-952(+)
MVPLESDSAERAREGNSTGAAAPILQLSKLAIQDGLLELEIAARKARDTSSAAVLQLRHTAEKQLGFEVEIEDRAVRGLFELHVLGVDDLLAQVRAQADATLRASELWNLPSLGPTAAGLRILSDAECGDSSPAGLEIAADLADTEKIAAEAAARAASRMAAEVFAPIDQRLHAHEQIREAIRQRQRLVKFSSSARVDVASLRKREGAAGLRSLNGLALGPLEEAEARLGDDMQRVAALDEQLLLQLTELARRSVDAVKKPWTALVQIQSEYFMSQQVAWATLGEAFDDYGGLACVRVT